MLSVVKTKLICFFDIKRVIHYEFVLPKQTVNQAFCLQVFLYLWQNMCRLDKSIFNHDNAPSHTDISAENLAKETNINVSASTVLGSF
jgi:hypothetical protein